MIWPNLWRNAFSTQFLPHIYCYLRDQQLIWLHLVSDTLIGVAYVAISFTLVYLIRRARRDIPFQWMFLAFGLFIISCGMTHFMEVVVLWKPVYWFSGDVKVVTALASVATAISLPRLVNVNVTMRLSVEEGILSMRPASTSPWTKRLGLPVSHTNRSPSAINESGS